MIFGFGCSVLADETAAPEPSASSGSSAEEAEESDSMNIHEKTYSLHMSDTQGTIEQTPNTPACWENPVLRPGEDLQAGTMTVKNESAVSATMKLSPIPLPYGDEAKLAYLDSIWVTISEGDEVLYQNTYAHINDEDGGFTLRYPEMAPGEEHVYTVKMRRVYASVGDPYTDDLSSVTPWSFTAQRQTVVMDVDQSIPSWLIVVLGVAVAAMLVMALVTLIRGARRR